MSVPCSDLRCDNTVERDGCFHDPEVPFCAEHLTNCGTCAYDIERDYLETIA